MNSQVTVLLPASVEFEGVQVPLSDSGFVLSHIMQGLRIRFQRCSAEDKTEAERAKSRKEFLANMAKGIIPATGTRGKPADYAGQAERLELTTWFLESVFITGKPANRRESAEAAAKQPNAWETVTRRYLIAALQANGKTEQEVKDLMPAMPEKVKENLPAVKAKFAAKIAARAKQLEEAAKAKQVKTASDNKVVLDVEGLAW
jgi:hypothetical protein